MSGERRPLVGEEGRGVSRAAVRVAATALVWLALLALVAVVVQGQGGRATELDEQVDDPLADLDDSEYKWKGLHSAGYDPVAENVFSDESQFEVPFAGYAAKSLHWKKPSAPIENVFDYLPTGTFTEPKSMELHTIAGPPPPEKNVITDLPLDY